MDEFTNPQSGQEIPLPESQELPPEELQMEPEDGGTLEAPAAAEAPQPDTRLDDMLDIVKDASARLAELSVLFERRIAHTDMEEKVIDQMHAELQKYKEDMYSQLLRPVLLDVIEVRDSIQRMAANYLARPEGEQSIPNQTFAGYAYDLQDILEKNQVEIYRSEPGNSFTPLRQRVVKKVKTDEESLHGTLAESLSCGYAYQGRVLSPEKIAVYLYEKPAGACEEKSEVPVENIQGNMENTEKSEENSNG